MTREETISILEESKRQNEIMRDNPSTFWASHQMAEGVKNAKRRIEAFEIALSALRPVSRELVEQVWGGMWIYDPDTGYAYCEMCKHTICQTDYLNGKLPPFCEMCGAPMTDEAVEMVMDRMEGMENV